MPKTGHLRGGQPTKKISLSLTEQEIERLDKIAVQLNTSRSALVGMIAEGELPLLAPENLLLGGILEALIDEIRLELEDLQSREKDIRQKKKTLNDRLNHLTKLKNNSEIGKLDVTDEEE